MDREPELLNLLKERGPISVRRLMRLTNFPKRLINGALHGSKYTRKHETRHPLWSFSNDGPIRPVALKKKIDRKQDGTQDENPESA